jgi:hypothetical protein
MFVCLFVCPRNYLNNVQDLIKLRFCQLRLDQNPNTMPLLGGSEVSHRICSKYNGIFINENTIFIHENTKNTYEIASFLNFSTLTLSLASFPTFSTLTLSRLYLFSSIKIPRTHMKSLHIWFLHLIGHKKGEFHFLSSASFVFA